ncbi:MAG: S46 family peptidase [Bacteroidales bacterium]
MRRRLFVITAALFSVFLLGTLAEEGMYPITELSKLNLKAKGLKIDPASIYNPKGVSLIEAIVNIGGCSASFVSNDGLIVTNHHCVFGSVQQVSTPEKDYLTNGFLAPTRSDELRVGMTARITEEVRDVTTDVMGAVNDAMDPLERTKAIDGRIAELTKKAQEQLPGKAIAISEMLAGKSYVMFIATTLRDVRLVYVPPRSIGEFGGEDDNWVWPRHTGDFSFIRAYVGKDGKPAAYATDNVPYHPRRFLKVNPNGVNENDFVFILGYPGRTYRHQTSYYMAYEEKQRMPFVADLYEWQIKTMEDLGKESRATALKFDARIKGLANTMKNYRGKLVGMKRMQLVAKKQEEEVGLQKYIDADPQRKARYGTVLADTGKIYADMTAHAQYELVLDNLQSVPTLMGYGRAVYEAANRPATPDAAQAGGGRGGRGGGPGGPAAAFANYYEPADKLFFKKVVTMAAKLPKDQRIPPVDAALQNDFSDQNIDRYAETCFAKTTLKTPEGYAAALTKTADDIAQLNDPFVGLAKELAPLAAKLRDVRTRRNAELSKLAALLIDVKQQYQQKNFIPDANGTLRFTYGHIKGYSPSDAVYHSPITTLTGVMEKTGEEFPYATPQAVRDLYKAKDFAPFKLPNKNDVPVAILYDTDTTGGNSGSAVMNANGELVGINFDRAWGATINDYAWNEAYSRSIAVDIRYVLWVTQKVGKADWLLKEMGVGAVAPRKSTN